MILKLSGRVLGRSAGHVRGRRNDRGAREFWLSAEFLEQRCLLSDLPLQAPSVATSAYTLPIAFEPNQGQTDPQVNYLAHGAGYTLFLSESAATLTLQAGNDTSEGIALRMQLLGASAAAESAALVPTGGMSNYFIGNDQSQWHTNIPTYGKVEYQNVYPGVSLDYYGNQGMLEYDFTVSPGISPGVIRFAIQGAQSVTLDAQGDLVLGLPGGPLIEHAPTLYQTIDGVPHDVPGGFVLSAGDQVGFQVGAYDTALPLVIDPTLAYSTYLGGSLGDKATAVAVDQAGDAYVTGETGSNDFPITTGAYDNKLNGSGTPGNTVTDVFVTKFNPSGQLVYSTYLGGETDDHGTGIAILNGNAYVTGWTDSTDFPTTSGVLERSFSGGTAPGDGFVTELNSTGTALVYSTYLGGSDSDQPNAIAVDSAGDAYVVGETESDNFPTKNPLQTSNGDEDGFLVKLNPTGTALVYGTYITGIGDDAVNADAYGVAVDPSNEAIVVGGTQSAVFPITPNAYQTTNNGASNASDNAFVTKFNAAGTGLIYSTFLGGSVMDDAYAVATDSSGDAYVTGETFSSDFPVTPDAAQSVFSYIDTFGLSNAFVAKLAPYGGLLYSTFLGGGGLDSSAGGQAIAVDSQGDAYVTGFTADTSTPFPTVNAFEPDKPGDYDAFVTEVSPDGSNFLYSSYLGGVTADYGFGIGVDGNGNAYVVGETTSTAQADGGTLATFPTVNAIKTTPPPAGETNGFVTRVNLLDPGAGTFRYSVDGEAIFQTTEAAGFVTIEVTRSGGDTAAADVSYSTSNGTGTGAAKAGTNYTATSGTLDFAQGQTTATFNVPILDDGKNDGVPYLVFNVALSGATNGATIDSTYGTGKVWVYDIETTNTDNDLYEDAIPLAGSVVTATGSNVGYTSNTGLESGGDPYDIYDYPVTDSKSVSNPKNDGGASAWWIWSPPASGIATIDTFGSNFDTLLTVAETDLTVESNLGGGHLIENDDAPGIGDGTSEVTFFAQQGVAYRIDVQGYDSGGGPAEGNIVLHINGQAPGSVQFTEPSYDIGENDGEIAIPVTRSGGSAGAVSVQVVTGSSSDTAVAGVDYTAVTQTLTWAAGDMSTQDIVIPILNHHASGNSPTFTVTLENPTGDVGIGSPSSTQVVIFQPSFPAGTISLGGTSFTVNEDAGSVEIPVDRSNEGEEIAVSVQIATGGGTAVAGTDYSSVSQTLFWTDAVPNGVDTITIPILDRGLTSGSKTVNITISSPTDGAALAAPTTAVLTINDNDPAAGTIALGQATFSANENAGSISIPVTRKAGSTGAVSVQLSTSDGTAVAGLDYTAVSQTINWAAGDSSTKTVSIPITDRGLSTGSKTFNITLTNLIGGAVSVNPSTAVLTIADNDTASGAIALGSATYSVNENGGSISIPVSRTGGTSGAVSVKFSTSDGTGVAGTDYTAVTQTLNWAAGVSSTQNVSIPILDRGLTSGSKTVNITLSSASGGATLGSPSTAVLTIADNDPTPGALALGAATYSVNENGGSISIPVSRTGGSSGAVSVKFSTSDGTGVAGTDYTAVTQTLNWAAGVSSTQNVSIPILDRGLTSGSKTVNITLSSASGGATLGSPSTAVLTIMDNDPTPGALALGAATYSVNENGGSISIPVSRTGGTSGAVSVKFSTSDGTGVAGTDYTAVTQTLNWAAGVSSTQNVSIPILDRGLTSGSKTVNITLSSASGGATLGSPSTAVLTIMDNDPAPGALALGAATYSVNENGASISIPVSRTGGLSGAVSVKFSTSNGTGAAGTDYTAVTQTLNWAAGDSSTQNVSIPILDRGLTSGSKTVNLTLSSATGGATLGSPSTAVLTIIDDDGAPGSLALSAATFSVNENGGSVSIPVSRTGGSTGAVSVDFTTSNGTGVAGTDYTTVTQTLNWASGDASTKNVSIPILDRGLTSGSKTVNIAISTPKGGATLGSPSTAVLTIADNDVAHGALALGAATYSVNENGGSISIPVSRTGGSGGAVSVQFSTNNGTGAAGTDYTSVTQVLNWADGNSSTQNVTIPILDRGLTSGSKTVNITLKSPTGGVTLGSPSTAVLTINDNDAVPASLQFSASTYSVSEDAGSITILVTRTQGSTGAVSVQFHTSNGTAQAGIDYTAVTQTLNWSAGDTSTKQVSIPVLDNPQATGDETINLNLSNPASGAFLGTPSAATLTIHAVKAVLQFAHSQFSANVLDGDATLSLSRTGNLLDAVTVVVQSPGGSAIAPFQKSITFAANAQTATFTVPIQNNGVPGQSDVTVPLSLSSPGSGASLGTTVSASLVIHDNNPFPPPVTASLQLATAAIKMGKGKKAKTKKETVLELTFTGPVSGAGNLGAYQLFSGKTNKKHVTTFNKRVTLSSALFTAGTASSSVMLIPKSALNLAVPEQLTVISADLTDSFGRPLDGGQNFIATFSKKTGVTVTAARLESSPPASP